MNLSDLLIENGETFTIRQLKERLNLMGILYDKEDVNKSTLVRLYDEALADDNNKRKILKELITDTNAKGKASNKDILNRREQINVEVSKEPKFPRNFPVTSLNLTANSGSSDNLKNLIPQTRNQQKFNNDFYRMGDDSKQYNVQHFNDYNKDYKLAVSNGKPFFDEKTLSEINEENAVKGKFANNLSSKSDFNMDSQAIWNTKDTNNYVNSRGVLDQGNFRVNEDREQIKTMREFGNSNNRNTITARETNSIKNTLSNLPPNFTRGPEVLHQQQNQSSDADNRKSSGNIPNFSFGNAGNDNANNRSFMPSNNTNQNYLVNNQIIPNNIDNPNANNNLRSNSRNTIANFKNIEDLNKAVSNKMINYQENDFTSAQQPKDDNTSNNLRNSYNYNTNYNYQSKHSLNTIKEAENENNSNSLNKNEINNAAETANIGLNRVNNNNLNFDNSNANLIGMNSINIANSNFNGTFNQNYKGLDSINAAKNLQSFGNINPYPIPEINTPNNQSFGNNIYPNNFEDNYSVKQNLTRADFNRETSSKNIPDLNKKMESSKLNAYTNPSSSNNLFNVNLQTQNQPNNQQEQLNQQQEGNQNYNHLKTQENYRPFGRRSSQGIQIKNQNANNNQLIDINPQPANQRQFGPEYPTFSNNNYQNDFNNMPFKRTSFTKIPDGADSIMDVKQSDANSQRRMISDEVQNIPFDHPETQATAKATEESYFGEFQNIFIALFIFGLLIISLAGLNHAQLIDLDRFASRSLEIMGTVTPENAIRLFDQFTGLVLQIIQKIFSRILAFTGASIWNNIYLIIFLVFAVLVIRYFYLKIHHRRIANEIYEVIRNRLRDIRRANMNDYRAGIRVDDIVNEFSLNYNINQNAFRDNILPLLKSLRSKDEDIRSFGDNEGGKYYEKWQFKGF